MSGPELGQQIWQPTRKQVVLAVTGMVAVLALLLVTLPADKPRPLRATSVSRPSELAPSMEASGATATAAEPSPEAPVPVVTATPTVAISVKPAEGRYTYRMSTETIGERSDEEISWLVTHPGEDLVAKTSATGRDGEPNKESQTYTDKWSATDVSRIAIQFPASEDKSSGRRCTMEPALLDLPLPLELGMRWESAAYCGEGKERTTFENAGHVIRTERVGIAGVEMDTFVIEISSGLGQRGMVWFATEGTEWFAPALGMAVRRDTATKETETGSGFEQDRSLELLAWPGSPPT